MASKIAYPQGGVDFYEASSPRPVGAWIETAKEIFGAMNRGVSLEDGILGTTKDWAPEVVTDFRRWLKFYQDNDHMKYKLAQLQNYNISLDDLRPEQLLPEARPAVDGKKEKINKKIRGIVARISAAEKLFSDPSVMEHLCHVLKMEPDEWLEKLNVLKRVILVAPLKNASSTLLEDLIIREANICASQGFLAESKLLIKLAQDALPLPPLPDAPPAAPTDPAAPPTTTPEPAPSTPSEPGKSKAISEFIKNLNKGDESEVKDEAFADDLEVSEDELLVTAQEASPPPVPPAASLPPTPEAAISVDEDDTAPPQAPPQAAIEVVEDITDAFDAALQNTSMNDIIVELEGLANIFKTREISRIFSKVDLMMDYKGIATYFPQLAEANSRMLETNQYVLSRLEDTLSKLRGSLTPTNPIELVDDSLPTSIPITNTNEESIKKNLQNQTDKDQRVKEQRRKKEQDALLPKPEIQAPSPEELAQPAKVVPPTV